jgi:hypothetical protein
MRGKYVSKNCNSIFTSKQRKEEIVAVIAEALASMPHAATVPHKKIPQNHPEKPLSCSPN